MKAKLEKTPLDEIAYRILLHAQWYLWVKKGQGEIDTRNFCDATNLLSGKQWEVANATA